MNFIIINGKEVYLKIFESMEDAKAWCISVCDHSQEIIVRQIESIEDIDSGLSL
jgi:hypothetical protein